MSFSYLLFCVLVNSPLPVGRVSPLASVPSVWIIFYFCLPFVGYLSYSFVIFVFFNKQNLPPTSTASVLLLRTMTLWLETTSRGLKILISPAPFVALVNRYIKNDIQTSRSLEPNPKQLPPVKIYVLHLYTLVYYSGYLLHVYMVCMHA